MRIAQLPVIFFHGRWWGIREFHISGKTALFFPEERRVLALSEMKAIVAEMEKMEETYVRPE